MIQFATKRFAQGAISALVIALTGCSTEYYVTPVSDNSLSVRYEQGHAIVYSDKRFGSVQITPLGMNSDDRLGFAVAALNKGNTAANFGIENISLLQADGTPGRLFTATELEHEAKVKAGWLTFAAVLGAVGQGMAANANAHSTTSGVAYTPSGPVSYFGQSYNPAVAQEGMHEADEQFSDNMHSIHASLDESINTIQNRVLQTTTIDPGDSYGGVALVDTLSSSKFPQTFELGVNWNGEDHVFRFIVSADKSPAPEQAALEPAAENPTPIAEQPASPPPLSNVSLSLQRKQALPEGYSSHSDATNAPEAGVPAARFDQWEKAQSKPTESTSTGPSVVIQGAVSQN
ncbi:MAG TPA: hypothetical protein VHX61_06910 [Rhizomicrobium sp.]|jgi:hypothetical protein|nr:hypothetical protein [Rhizomicrobium sp.]